jgi:endo-alpha-1,4-polygalactosaminidase (GH114 family)
MAVSKAKKYIESELYKEIRQDILDQLERNGTTGKYYLDLVDDYMDMWTTTQRRNLPSRRYGIS